MTKYEIHPYCAAFPDIDGEEFDALRKDLKDHGQQEPCWVYGNWLIDGKNRVRAMEANKQPITYEKWSPVSRDAEKIDREILDFCVSKNLRRRHLDASQRAMIAAKMATGAHGGDRTQAANLPLTHKAAAESMNVSERSVRDAVKVSGSSPQEVVKAVESGTVKVSDAAKIADQPKTKQKRALAKVESGKAPTLAKAAKPREGNRKLDFDDSIIDGHYSKIVRSIDSRSKVLKCEKSAGHKACLSHLDAFYDAWKAWRKETKK